MNYALILLSLFCYNLFLSLTSKVINVNLGDIHPLFPIQLDAPRVNLANLLSVKVPQNASYPMLVLLYLVVVLRLSMSLKVRVANRFSCIYIYFLNLYLPLHYKLVITSFIILFQARTKLLAVTKKTSSRALPLNNVQPDGWETHQLICPAQNVAKDLQVVKVHQKTDVVLATKVLTVSHLGVNHAWNVQ